MATIKLSQLLESSRWRPYQLGSLASLPVTAVLVLSWLYWDIFAIVWFCFYPFWAGLGVFWKTPTRKAVSTALLVGIFMTLMVMPFLIKYAR